jgi:glycosyltransferase involved in cell wall biosynthesis
MSNHSLEPQFLADAQGWSHVLDGMIGTSRLIARMAEEYTSLERRRLLYAPCGTEVSAEPRTNVGRGGDSRLRIAYSGRLEKDQKRVQDLGEMLRALEALEVAYEFRIAGTGPFEPELRQELAEKVGAGLALFLGRLAPEELNRELYGWADVLLVTSFWETGPIVIWEAMAHRVAIVSSQYVGSGYEGSLRHGENCLLFPVGDAGEAARQLARLTDTALHDRITEAAYALVGERYTCERSVEAWDRAFRAILELPVPDLDNRRTQVPAAGRLDRLLGTGMAEAMRRALGVSFRHADPGGEWPHAMGGPLIDREEYWERARSLDRLPAQAEDR